jgi:hypothetical protein
MVSSSFTSLHRRLLAGLKMFGQDVPMPSTDDYVETERPVQREIPRCRLEDAEAAVSTGPAILLDVSPHDRSSRRGFSSCTHLVPSGRLTSCHLPEFQQYRHVRLLQVRAH